MCTSSYLLTLGVHVQEGYCSCLCLCLCVSVKSHLTSGTSVHPENAVMYSVGNEGQKICWIFSEKSVETRKHKKN